jgi:hypothetical protein
MTRPGDVRLPEFEFLWNGRICAQLLIRGLPILCPKALEEKGTAKQEKK